MRSFLRLIFLLCRPGLVLKTAVFVLGLAALWLFINHQRLQQYFNDRSHLNNYQDEVSALERQQTQLTREKEQLAKGGFPAEKAIRERFMLVKPGERVIQLDDQDSTASAAAADTPTSAAEAESTPKAQAEAADTKTTKTTKTIKTTKTTKPAKDTKPQKPKPTPKATSLPEPAQTPETNEAGPPNESDEMNE